MDVLVLDHLTKNDSNLLENALKKYHSTQQDSSRIKALVEISEHLADESWIEYNNIVGKIAKKAYAKTSIKRDQKFYKKYYASYLNNKGYWHMVKGDIQAALTFYEKALILNHGKENLKGLGTVYTNIGLCHKKRGDIQMALHYYLKALKIQEEINDEEGLGYTYNNLGLLYKKQGEIDLAVAYYQKSLAIKEKIGNTDAMAATLINIGMLRDAKEDYDISLQYYYRAHKIDSLKGNKYGIGLALSNIAQTLAFQGRHEEAYEMNIRGLKVAEEVGDKRGMSYALNNLTRSKLNQGLIEEAHQDAKRAMIIAKEIGFPDNISQSALILSDINVRLNNGIAALEMYKLHVKMRDSLNNEATQKATIRQQTQYEFEKAQIVKENEAKEKARLEAEATGRRNNLQYSLIFLGILVLFGIVLSLGFIKVSPNIAEGIIFFAFLILFEFLLVFSEPYLENYTNGEPMYNLLANSLLALLIFPVHAILEKLLKKRIVK